MEINNLEHFLSTIASGRIALGACITYTDPAVTETAAASGLDFCWIDCEHGEFERTGAMLHIMALRGTKCAPLVRVPACSHTEIKKVIDYGPAGIIIPMIMTADDARLAVAACRYPPIGNRGCGFRRGVDYGAGDFQKYWEDAKHDPLVILQIEHITAYENLDEILAVPGVDAILVGPYDFTASMDKAGQWDDPEVVQVLDETCRKALAAGKILGTYSECKFDVWKKRGVQFMGIANDTNAMLRDLVRRQAEFREA